MSGSVMNQSAYIKILEQEIARMSRLIKQLKKERKTLKQKIKEIKNG